jgi:DNA processing protein
LDAASTADWIALNLLPGLGPISARRAVDRYGDPAEIAYRLPVDEIRALGRIANDELAELPRARRDLRRRAERELARAERAGVTILPLAHPDYPAALAEITDAPVVLYVRGTLPSPVVRLAVVGSRTPTPYGTRLAAGLAGQLAARGIEVVSGGARGIDSRAHEGALAEAGGRTVAVLGSGLARLYPPENEKLFERIAAHGAVLTEFPLDYPPLGENFLRRNRIISGLSAAVVVVEAAQKSGALSTANHALEQGREVMALPGSVQSLKSVGCHRLIQQGAKLVQDAADILAELPPPYRGAVGPGRAEGDEEPAVNRADLTPDENDVLGILTGTEPVQLDRLAELVPFGIARLQTALFGLEIRGAVEQSPGRYYVLRPK